MADGDGKFKSANNSNSGIVFRQSNSNFEIDSSGEDDPEKSKLRRGISMPVIKQDESATNLTEQQSPLSQIS